MRRLPLLVAAVATTIAASAVPAKAGHHAAHPATPAYHPAKPADPPRRATRPTPPSSVQIYRDPVYSDRFVHPGFYGGFDRYGAVLPRSGTVYPGYGGLLGGRGDTNVDVDVRTRQGGAAPVVVAPPATDTPAMAALRRENWHLRRSIEPSLDYLGIAATARGEGAAELRGLVGTIIAERERERRERVSGARVVAVEDYQRELGDTRAEIRRLEHRPRNKHILYLGFDD